MPWVTDWADSYRHQPPLPRPVPDEPWVHSTVRFELFDVSDEPFVLIDGSPVEILNDTEVLAMFSLIDRHQTLLARHAAAYAHADITPLAGLVADDSGAHVAAVLAGLEAAGEVREQSPYTHEIGAIAYYPASERAVVYEIYRNATFLPRALHTGDILHDIDPSTLDAPGVVGFVLTWWSRERSGWVATHEASLATTDLEAAGEFVAEYFDALDPYHRLWLAALLSEEGAQAE